MEKNRFEKILGLAISKGHLEQPKSIERELCEQETIIDGDKETYSNYLLQEGYPEKLKKEAKSEVRKKLSCALK